MRTAIIAGIVAIIGLFAMAVTAFIEDIAPPVETATARGDRVSKRCRAAANRLPSPLDGATVLEKLSIGALPRSNAEPRRRWI
ncbi:MAG TPA: hypothetical protein VIQ05_11055 [Tardiphaga sp.]